MTFSNGERKVTIHKPMIERTSDDFKPISRHETHTVLKHHVFLLSPRFGNPSSRHWVPSHGVGTLVRTRVCGHTCGPLQTRTHTFQWTDQEAFQLESAWRGRRSVTTRRIIGNRCCCADQILVRAPCPVMNTLANHDFVPHSGRNITMPVFVQACLDAFNISAAFCIDAFGTGVAASNPVPNSTVSRAPTSRRWLSHVLGDECI